jgi:hypothetical protein
LGTRLSFERQLLDNAFTYAQDRAIYLLLPDRCTIRPGKNTDYTVNADGIGVQTTSANRQWRGSEDIPCRADINRAFRPDTLEQHATTVDELDLHLPFDVVLDDEDIVTYNGATFKLRKHEGETAFTVTQVAKIMRVTAEHD